MAKSITSSWAVRSLVLNAGGTVIDYALLFGLVEGLGAPTPAAAVLGLFSGASFNFVMNRRYVFTDCSSPIGAQAFRYACGIGALLLLHVSVLSALVDWAQVPLVVAKPACDITLLGLGQLVVLRWFVFAGQTTRGSEPAVTGAANVRE